MTRVKYTVGTYGDVRSRDLLISRVGAVYVEKSCRGRATESCVSLEEGRWVYRTDLAFGDCATWALKMVGLGEVLLHARNIRRRDKAKVEKRLRAVVDALCVARRISGESR